MAKTIGIIPEKIINYKIESEEKNEKDIIGFDDDVICIQLRNTASTERFRKCIKSTSNWRCKKDKGVESQFGNVGKR